MDFTAFPKGLGQSCEKVDPDFQTVQVAQWQRIRLPMQETQESWVWSLGLEDSLEKEMATHSSILSWEIPRIKKPGGL